MTPNLTRGLSLERGLDSASALIRLAPAPIACLRALGFFDDPALDRLPKDIKLRLQAAIKAAVQAGEAPKAPLISSVLN
ncbi:MAG: hypothetical protein A2413_15270 [Treponema sp. RIFOXYC1_FULL_61_9]|nr:MAG: hypothetical protein A2413_15270 [Treponema sp. RIFOXYC1_FULL_61_9]